MKKEEKVHSCMTGWLILKVENQQTEGTLTWQSCVQKKNVYHYWQHDKKGIIDKWGGQSGKKPWQERTEIL